MTKTNADKTPKDKSVPILASLRLKAIQSDFAEEQAVLQEKFVKEKAALIQEVKEELARQLDNVSFVWNSLPPEIQLSIFTEPHFQKMLKDIRLKPIDITDLKPRKPRSPSVHVSDEQILAFLKEEEHVRTKDVQDEFGFTPVMVGKRLDALRTVGKINFRKHRTSKLWSLG